MRIKYIEVITGFAPTKSTPCWSVYAEAKSLRDGGNYAHGHSYGKTCVEAQSEAISRLRHSLQTVVRDAVWIRIN